jgi:hypothetical protein
MGDGEIPARCACLRQAGRLLGMTAEELNTISLRADSAVEDFQVVLRAKWRRDAKHIAFQASGPGLKT